MTPPRKVSAAKASNDDVVLTRTGTALVVAVIVLVILVIAFVTLYTLQVLKTNGKATLITIMYSKISFLPECPTGFLKFQSNVLTKPGEGFKFRPPSGSPEQTFQMFCLPKY